MLLVLYGLVSWFVLYYTGEVVKYWKTKHIINILVHCDTLLGFKRNRAYLNTHSFSCLETFEYYHLFCRVCKGHLVVDREDYTIHSSMTTIHEGCNEKIMKDILQ